MVPFFFLGEYMVINTGQRTDIVAFYMDWLINRIKEGYVYVRNPFNNKQVNKYSLRKEDVDIMAFCTKNPRNLLKNIDFILDYYKIILYVTITPYSKDIEQIDNKREILNDFKELSKILSLNNIVWRYDPIFFTDKYDYDFHINSFKSMCKYLKGYTNKVVVSFIDLYDKVKINAPDLKRPDYDTQIRLLKELASIAKENDMVIYLCHDKINSNIDNINQDGCMTKEILEKACNKKLDVKKTDMARLGCECIISKDIGAYNSCMHLCRYCYANFSKELVKKNRLKHDPSSPFLIGNIEECDQINERYYIEKKPNLFNLD